MSRNDMDQPPDKVILEDLDRVEAEREGSKKKFTLKDLFFPGQKGDLLLWRRLFSFARPYMRKIILCLFLSMILGGMTGLKLWLIKGGIEAIMKNPTGLVEDLGEWLGGKLDSILPDFLKGPEEEAKAEDEEEENPAGSIEKELPPAEAKKLLILIMIIFFLVVLFEQAGKYFQSVMIRAAGHRIVMDIRNALFARVMSFSMKFHNKNHSGKLISRLTNDLTIFGTFFTHTATMMVQDFFMLLACFFYLMMESGLAFIGMLAILALAFTPIQMIARNIRKRDKKIQRSTSLIYSALAESLSGQKIVKAFGTEDYEYEKFRQVSAFTYRNTMKSARLRSGTQPVVELVGSLVVVIIFFYLGFEAIDKKMTFGSMSSVGFALVLGISPLRRLAKANNNIQSAFASADRVATLMYSEPEIVDLPDAGELERFEREIVYDHVHFEHNEGIPVLKDIHFTISKGEVVALVGPSGSGKTTLADLLPRFYDVVGGGISIDGIDIRHLTLKSLRGHIGIVSQEPILFNDTVRMNISYGMPDCDQSRIEEAAKAANAHDFIMEMEDGYDTLIGERGVRLSGGQKQRLAIARAILKNPPILILDEATSSLDSEAEYQVQEALFRLMEGRTTLVIAHRLSTIRDADKIIVIKDNRIVEVGRHEDLLEQAGVYAKLHELQTEGSERTS